MHRQGHNKGGAPINFRRVFDGAAMQLDGFLDDGQPQAGALNAGHVSGAIERFKQPLARFGWNAQTVIGDGEDQF